MSQASQTGASTTTSSDPVLFSESFTLSQYSQQKYDRVARIAAASADGDCSLSLDINTELLAVGPADTFLLTLASTLNLDGTRDEEALGGRGGSAKTGWRNVSVFQGMSTLADGYDYVCHGRVYKFEDGGTGSMTMSV